jgi:hypothetical protein
METIFLPFIHEQSVSGGGGGGSTTLKIFFNYLSTSPIFLTNLLSTDIIDEVEVTVTTVWNGGSPTIEIGTPATPDKVFKTSESKLKKLGTYRNADNIKQTIAETLQGVIVQSGATQGEGFVLVKLA